VNRIQAKEREQVSRETRDARRAKESNHRNKTCSRKQGRREAREMKMEARYGCR
jgi:hypothetical protein